MAGSDLLLRADELGVSHVDGRGHGKALVRGVSLTLHAGEVLCVLGESGAGKSLLAHALIQIPPADGIRFEGRVYYRDVELSALSERRLRTWWGRRITLLFQDASRALHPRWRIGAQLEALCDHFEVQASVEALLDEVGLDGRRAGSLYPFELSGGMRQLAYLAMGLACPARVLLLDEPTSAMDLLTRDRVIALLDRHRRAGDRAMMIITHDVEFCCRLADRIMIMYRGAIVEDARPRNGFLHPYSRRLMYCREALRGRTHARPVVRPEEEGGREERGGNGCPYAPSCPEADEQCREQTPPLRDMGDGHRIACHHPLNGQRE